MPLVGVTGGYSTGKSLVSSMLVDMGAHLIDCDQLAREVVEPGTNGLERVVEIFGEGILAPDGSLDREALGDIVFHDQKSREKLEAVLHPIILKLVDFRAKKKLERSPGAVVVVEAALLFESGLYKKTDCNITVTCSPDKQLERAKNRDNLTEDEINARITSQWTLEKKAELSEFVIDNSGVIEKTREQAETIWEKIS